MARINVYVPDELAAQAKQAGLNLSAVTQDAIRRNLDSRSTDLWVDLTTSGPPSARVPHDQAIAALDAAREAPPTRHG